MDPGAYNFPLLKRGDTFTSRAIATITDSTTGDPVAVSSATLQVRTKGQRSLVHEWTTEGDSPNATISGDGSNVITLGEVSDATTATWAVGTHVYDLEITTATGSITRTILQGTFPVSADITIPTA